MLDGSDRIVSVGPDWDRFPLENDTPDAVADRVIGRPWWDCVSGQETRSYLNAIFFSCRREKQNFSILYRCDAPWVQRMFRMTVTPTSDEGLILDHALVHTKATLAEAKVHVLTDHHDATRCSVCCGFKVGDSWTQAYLRPDLRFFPKGYAICSNCRAEAVAQIADGSRQTGTLQSSTLN